MSEFNSLYEQYAFKNLLWENAYYGYLKRKLEDEGVEFTGEDGFYVLKKQNATWFVRVRNPHLTDRLPESRAYLIFKFPQAYTRDEFFAEYCDTLAELCNIKFWHYPVESQAKMSWRALHTFFDNMLDPEHTFVGPAASLADRYHITLREDHPEGFYHDPHEQHTYLVMHLLTRQDKLDMWKVFAWDEMLRREDIEEWMKDFNEKLLADNLWTNTELKGNE